MNKHFKLSKHCLFLVSVYFLLSSCGSDDSTTADTNTAMTTVSPATTDASPATAAAVGKAAALTGMLDNLWVSATEFKKLKDKKKVVFSFTFRDPDILTLWGWQCQNNNCTDNFLDPADLKLEKGQPSGVNYGPNVIFGNVVILKEGVKPIKDKLGNTYQYVVFVPYASGEYINYKIYVTNDNPKSALTALTLEDTGIETNPSPPKNNSN